MKTNYKDFLVFFIVVIVKFVHSLHKVIIYKIKINNDIQLLYKLNFTLKNIYFSLLIYEIKVQPHIIGRFT